MAVREFLEMGDPRLRRVAPSVRTFEPPELHALIGALFDTVKVVYGTGRAAPWSGVHLGRASFGFTRSERFSEVPPMGCIPAL